MKLFKHLSLTSIIVAGFLCLNYATSSYAMEDTPQEAQSPTPPILDDVNEALDQNLGDDQQKQAILAELQQSSIQENLAHLLATPTRSARAFKKSRYGADWLVPNFDDLAKDFEKLTTQEQTPMEQKAPSYWSRIKGMASHLKPSTLKSCVTMQIKTGLIALRSCSIGIVYGFSGAYDVLQVIRTLLIASKKYALEGNLCKNTSSSIHNLCTSSKNAMASIPSACKNISTDTCTYLETLCSRTRTIINSDEALAPLTHAWQLATGILFITQKKYPLFYAFLQGIAQKMNTTLPQIIFVFRPGIVLGYLKPLDTFGMTYNAAVGYISSFFDIPIPLGSMMLIGMPFIEKLSLEHLAAIIAHELGHKKMNTC